MATRQRQTGPVWEFTGDLRGEAALATLPLLHAREDFLKLVLADVSGADAWTGCCIRALLEYATTWMQMPVHIVPPREPRVWALLAALVGPLPNRVTIEGRRTTPQRAHPDVVLPAHRVAGPDLAAALTDSFPTIVGRAFASPRLRFACTALATLVTNACTHGRDSVIDAIACVARDADTEELQVVVTDLGGTVAAREKPDVWLAAAWHVDKRTRVPGGLRYLALIAERLDVEVGITLRAGAGRIRWRGGDPNAAKSSRGRSVPGFTAAVAIH